MAANKKTKKRHTKAQGTVPNKMGPARKTAKKRVARKKASLGQAAGKPKPKPRKKIAAKKGNAPNRPVRRKSQGLDDELVLRKERATLSGRQSGDLQGLSSIEGADSESVNELLEEGNAFEADVVTGVEQAGNSDEKEVRTREVPEDDVPGEYLDEK